MTQRTQARLVHSALPMAAPVAVGRVVAQPTRLMLLPVQLVVPYRTFCGTAQLLPLYSFKRAAATALCCAVLCCAVFCYGVLQNVLSPCGPAVECCRVLIAVMVV
jgi:hypothetical protein